MSERWKQFSKGTCAVRFEAANARNLFRGRGHNNVVEKRAKEKQEAEKINGRMKFIRISFLPFSSKKLENFSLFLFFFFSTFIKLSISRLVSFANPTSNPRECFQMLDIREFRWIFASTRVSHWFPRSRCFVFRCFIPICSDRKVKRTRRNGTKRKRERNLHRKIGENGLRSSHVDAGSLSIRLQMLDTWTIYPEEFKHFNVSSIMTLRAKYRVVREERQRERERQAVFIIDVDRKIFLSLRDQ